MFESQKLVETFKLSFLYFLYIISDFNVQINECYKKLFHTNNFFKKPKMFMQINLQFSCFAFYTF